MRVKFVIYVPNSLRHVIYVPNSNLALTVIYESNLLDSSHSTWNAEIRLMPESNHGEYS